MAHIILEVFWFYTPAMVANMAPVFFARYGWLESLSIPVDRGMKWRHVRLFGDHKTVRGFIVGIALSMLAAYLQHILFGYEIGQEIAVVNYNSAWFSVWLGFLLGFGALMGDALKSFLKRQCNVMPGHSWPVFDQIDFVLGASLTTWWLVDLTYWHVIVAIALLGIASFVVSAIGVVTHLKEDI